MRSRGWWRKENGVTESGMREEKLGREERRNEKKSDTESSG